MESFLEKIQLFSESELKNLSEQFKISYDFLNGNTSIEKSISIYNYLIYVDKLKDVELWYKNRDKSKSIPIYFSYAWKDKDNKEHEILVNQLYDELSKEGYNLFRDKKNLKIGNSILQFMKQIGSAQFIIVFISEKYLQSDYCMFELYEVYRNSKLEKNKFQEKVLPIFIENIKQDCSTIKEFWNKRLNEIKSMRTEMDDVNTLQFDSEYNQIKEIHHYCCEIFSCLKDSVATAFNSINEVRNHIDTKLNNEIQM